jgi:SAM-dependent methyltransferase
MCSMSNSCIICSSTKVTPFLEILQMPVFCNLLFATRVSALSTPRGDIKLAFCQDCGHIFNLSFEPEKMDYNQEYENSLHYSPKFIQYANDIASDLVARYSLNGVDILDIGCGTGEFLNLICELGKNHGTGFDPSYNQGNYKKLSETTEQGIEIIRDKYSEKYYNIKADFIICRHVLEHVDDPSALLLLIRRALKNKKEAGVYIEVPNMRYTIERLAIWDIIYEHFSYFFIYSLSRLMRSCGFKIQRINEGFEDQYICLDASCSNLTATNSADVHEDLNFQYQNLSSFAQKYQSKIMEWRCKIDELRTKKSNIVVWGAGSKGVTFLNSIAMNGEIDYVVDINPYKQGKFVAGAGQQIVKPEFLQKYKPDSVILMNPIYEKEIGKLTRHLDVYPDFFIA